MSFPKYEHYKDSGVEWLGDLPNDWRVSRLGFEAWVRARLGWKGLKADEYVDDGFPMLATPNIKGKHIDFDGANKINKFRFDESPEIKLRLGDVVLAKDGSTLGIVNVVRVLPQPATVNSSIAVITPNLSLNGSFLAYLFQSAFMVNIIASIKGGMGVPHLFQEDLNKLYLPLPPIAHQFEIVTFLDLETTKLDALIAEQRTLINLLKEKRQAVISHAVTKGLDPRVPMKDSGVEWLGEVPAHWIVCSLRRVIHSIEQGWSPECFARQAEGDEWGVLKAGCVNRGIFNQDENKALPVELSPIPEYEVRAGDVLMSRASGSPELVGSTARVQAVQPRLMLSDKIFRIHLNSSVAPDYFVLALNSISLREQIEQALSGGNGMANNLPQSSLLEFMVCLPPVFEQEEIFRRVVEETTRLDTLTAEAQTTIALLQERRSALISAAVTGKIDVCQAA